ncbi:hypothetical protein HZB02_05790 [Candidatus Woesearchaeota archaeon]|nr:hypothetical protein [Candidatus Woesearchaeota archaeon]
MKLSSLVTMIGLSSGLIGFGIWENYRTQQQNLDALVAPAVHTTQNPEYSSSLSFFDKGQRYVIRGFVVANVPFTQSLGRDGERQEQALLLYVPQHACFAHIGKAVGHEPWDEKNVPIGSPVTFTGKYSGESDAARYRFSETYHSVRLWGSLSRFAHTPFGLPVARFQDIENVSLPSPQGSAVLVGKNS